MHSWKDLIVYILANNLENEQIEFSSIEKAALCQNVGTATISAWIKMGHIPYITLEEKMYIPKIAVNSGEQT